MKKTLRSLAAYALTLVAGLSAVQFVGLSLLAFYNLDMAKTSAEEDAANVTTSLMPYLKSHPAHYSLYDLAKMRLEGSQLMGEMLAMTEQMFMTAGLWFCVGCVCWLLLRWFFPDRKELFKTGPIPGIPERWQRPLKLWRSRGIK